MNEVTIQNIFSLINNIEKNSLFKSEYCFYEDIDKLEEYSSNTDQSSESIVNVSSHIKTFI